VQTDLESDRDDTPAVAGRPPIIYFDGVCGMCNAFVNLILKADRRGEFRFAPLQGQTARESLPPLPADPREWSMLYADERGLHEQSDASIEVYRRLGGWWTVLGWARVIPRAVRNPVYRWIARNRFRIAGKRDACRVPTPEERARFLP
jgi:predicted DCC family thiol-disulfide oxidoreductase YuxK